MSKPIIPKTRKFDTGNTDLITDIGRAVGYGLGFLTLYILKILPWAVFIYLLGAHPPYHLYFLVFWSFFLMMSSLGQTIRYAMRSKRQRVLMKTMNNTFKDMPMIDEDQMKEALDSLERPKH